ncbi:MAG TPA: ABC transporter permease subunit [Polyangiales bacterium]
MNQSRTPENPPRRRPWQKTHFGTWLGLGLWSLLADTGILRHRAVAGPWAIARTALSDLRAGSLLADVAASAARVAAGVSLGLCAGLLLGASVGLAGARRQRMEPTLDFLRAVPPLFVFSLLLLSLGYGESARVLAVAWAAALIVALHVSDAVASVHHERLRTLRAMRATPLQLLRWLYLYELMPACLLSLRQAVTNGLIVAVVTEMLVGAPHGLGTRALSAQIAYDAPRLYTTIFLTGALGLAGSRLILAAQRKLVTWHS